MPRKSRIAHGIAVAMAAGAFSPAFAQAPPETQTIVVTAQSRKQAVQDVPMPVQVVTMNDIAALGAADLSDLNGYIPGLVVDSIEPTQPSFGIRGVNPGDFGIATDAPVGVYVDGVYTGKTGGALMNFIDVQRIEVIKGPQGTLFGRNSAAGAISIVTQEPGNDRELHGRVKLGEDGRFDMDAVMNLPLSASTAARLVFVRSSSDGWAHNATTGEDSAGDKSWATRLSLRSNIGTARVNVAWEHERLNQDGRPAFGAVKDPTIPFLPAAMPIDALVGALTGTDAATGNFLLGLGGITPERRGIPLQVLNQGAFMNPLAYSNPLKSPLENDVQGAEWRDFDGITLRVEMPVGHMTFNSLTAWRTFDTWNYTDNDGTARSDTYLGTLDAKDATSWQQEFKLSAKSDALDWIAGVSFFHNKEKQDAGAYLTTGSLLTLSTLQVYNALAAGGMPSNGELDFIGLLSQLPPDLAWDELTIAGVRTRSVSLYGDVIWHATPATNLTAGLRWTRDQKRASWYVPPRMSAALDGLLGQLEALGAIPPGTASALPPNVAFLDAVLRGAGTPTSAEHKWTDLSPRLVVDHKLNKDTLLFASVSRGYQAGGYNIFVPNPADEADGRFEPEKMTNLEVGFKAVFPQARATLNASLFKYKFKNLQDIELVTPAGGGVPTYNVVVSDQEATGIDIDGRWRITKQVSVFGAAEYIDQTYAKFVDPLGFDLEGQAVGTPKLTAMGGVNVNWAALGGLASLTFQGTHTSKGRCNDAQDADRCIKSGPFRTGEAKTRFDLRLGWESGEGHYGVALLVNNVFDKRYVETLGGQTAQIGMPYSYLTPPRFVGVEFKVGM